MLNHRITKWLVRKKELDSVIKTLKKAKEPYRIGTRIGTYGGRRLTQYAVFTKKYKRIEADYHSLNPWKNPRRSLKGLATS